MRPLLSSSIAVLVVAACAAGATFPTRTLRLPVVAAEQRRMLDDLGHRALAALSRGDADALCLDDQGLRAVLQPTAASRAAVLRASSAVAVQDPNEAAAVLRGCEYAGVCVQRARAEQAGGPLGLREAGFVLDRALVVCVEPGGGRIAAWVEGTFVLTDHGFFAIALQRLETPRRDHADLDLAPCDMQIGVRSPRPVVVSGPESH